MKSICTTDEYGTKHWFLDGKRHREDGPAVEAASGHKEWWVLCELHREDGPAIEYASGDKEWYLLDTRVEPFTPAQVPLLLLGLTDL